MNDKVISQPHLDIIWNADGSSDIVIALLYFLQQPNISVDAITVSCGLARPDIYTANLVRMLSGLGRKDIPIAAGRTTPLEGTNAFPETWRNATNGFWGIDLPEAECKRRDLLTLVKVRATLGAKTPGRLSYRWATFPVQTLYLQGAESSEHKSRA